MRPRSWRFGDKAALEDQHRMRWEYLHLDEASQKPIVLTSGGVVYTSIVDQHLIKEDDTSVTGERLLGKAG